MTKKHHGRPDSGCALAHKPGAWYDESWKTRHVIVRVIWDEEVQLWSARAINVPGLITEAPTVEHLQQALSELIPDFFADEPEDVRPVSFELIAQATSLLTAA